MVSRRVLLSSVGAVFAEGLVEMAKAQSGGRKVIFEQDIPDLRTQSWSATVIEVSYGPGEATGAHRHPGITIAYVIEGEIRSKVGDGPERTLSAGEVFLETPNQLHAVSRNASATKPARVLAVMLAEKGKQLTVPA